MGSFRKTDNHNPASKLALRRYFLRRYHSDGAAKVFDCCQGGGLLWTNLRSQFPIASYWGVDLKEKPGRLKIDSVKVLSQDGWDFDVIDVDTYGSPWKHWKAIVEHAPGPVTVFLTLGQVMMRVDGLVAESLGLSELDVPPAILHSLSDLSLPYLFRVGRREIEIIEAKEAESSGSARYFGLRITPKCC